MISLMLDLDYSSQKPYTSFTWPNLVKNNLHGESESQTGCCFFNAHHILEQIFLYHVRMIMFQAWLKAIYNYNKEFNLSQNKSQSSKQAEWLRDTNLWIVRSLDIPTLIQHHTVLLHKSACDLIRNLCTNTNMICWWDFRINSQPRWRFANVSDIRWPPGSP